MADDDKTAPGTGPTPEELQQSLQDFFGKMGNVQWGMAGMNTEPEESEPEVAQESAADSVFEFDYICLLYTSPSPRDATLSRMPSSA